MATPVQINIHLANNGNELYSQLDNTLTRFESGRQLNLKVSDSLRNKIRLEVKEAEKTPINLKVQIDKASLRKQVNAALKDVGGTYGRNGGTSNSSGTKSGGRRRTTSSDSDNDTYNRREVVSGLRRAARVSQKSKEGGLPGITSNEAYAIKTNEVQAYKKEVEEISRLYDSLSANGKLGDLTDPNDLNKWKQLESVLSGVNGSLASAKKSIAAFGELSAFDKLNARFFDYKNKFGSIIEKNNPEQFKQLLDLEQRFLSAANTSFPDKGVKELATDFEKLKGEIGASGAAMKTAGQQTMDSITTLARYTIVMGAYTSLISLTGKVIAATREMETRMAQLQIVTGESSSKIRQFGKDAVVAAKEVGSSATELMRSSETWARLGYNLENSLKMAKVTAAFANVADTSVEQGTESMTSILKAYEFDPSKLEYVSDVLVNLGKKYAVSGEELGIAFQNAGAALEAGGNTFEESAALITAGNAAVQDASKVGNALKTSSLRIRGSKAELEDMGEEIDDFCESSSKLRNEIKALTGGKVDIMFSDGQTYKSMYQIMLDIASVWDSMSDINQAALLEDISGKRNASVMKSIITNLGDLKGAYKDAFESTGTTMKSNEIALDTIDGKMKQLSATFQGWSKDIGLEGLIKLILSGATELLSVGDGIVGKIVAINVALAATHVLVTAIKNTGLLAGVGGNIKEAVTGGKMLLKTLGTTLLTFGKAHPILLTIAVATTAIGGAMIYATGKGERFQEQLEKCSTEKEKLNELGKQIDANNEKIADIQARGKLSLTDKAEIENLQRQNAELEVQRDLQKQLLDIEKQKLAAKINAGDYKETGKWSKDFGFMSFDKALERIQYNKDLIESGKYPKLEQHYNEEISKYKAFISSQLQEDINALKSYELLTDESRETILDRIYTAYEALDFGESEIANKAVGLANVVGDFSDVITDLKSNKISIDDVIGDKTGKYEEFLNFLARLNGITPLSKKKKADVEKRMSEYQVGNVDLNNRPIFVDEESGSYETVHSGWMEVGSKKNPIAVHYTPIIDANTELTQNQIDEYIYSIEDYLKSKKLKVTPDNILAADRGDFADFPGRNLVLKAENYNGNKKEQNQWGQNLHELQAEMYDADGELKILLSGLNETGAAADETAQKIKTVSDAISTLADIEKNLSKIPDLLKDFKDDGMIGTEQLAEIGETFKDVAGLDSYLETLSSSDLTFAQLSETLGTLTSELILTKIETGALSVENEALIAKMLKASGVANAESAAHELCAVAKEKNRLETLGLLDMTAEEISAMLNEQGASNATRMAILELIKAKIEALKTTITTAADVDQLIKLATAAGAATAQLGALSIAKTHFETAAQYDEWEDNAPAGSKRQRDAKAAADYYRKEGQKAVESEANEIMDKINANISKGFSSANITPKYTPTTDKTKSSKGKEDTPDYEDTTDAIIRRISAQERAHEKNIEAIDDKLTLIDTEKEYAEAIALVEQREAERAKRIEALLQKQKALSAQADSLRNSSGYTNTESWFDSDGEFTEAYYNLFNSLSTKTAQDNLKDFAQSLQKYKKEYLETDKDIQDMNKQILDDEKSIWDYRKKIADEYANEADDYIDDQEKHGWKNGDSKLAALYRKIQKISDETYKRLFKNEEEYWAFVEENIHKYIDALQERMDNAGDSLSRYVSKIKEAYDEQIKQKENLITEQKALYEIQEASFDAVNKVSDVYREINKELAASKIATEYLTPEERKQIFNEDDYNVIADKARSVNGEISALTSKFNDDIARAYKDGNLYLVETMTAEYKRQLDMKERELEITKKQVDLQKKRDALNNILNERNIRQIVEKNGKLQYEWTYDTDKARQAAEDLADVENDIARANTEYQQQGILNAQQGYIDMLTNKKGALEKAIEMITAASEKVSKMIDELKNPISTANKLIVDFGSIGIASLNSSMNDFLDILSSATGKSYARLSTNTLYDKNHDYMEDINAELAKGANANWYKIAEANTKRNAKIKGENLDNLPWQGISSKTDSMGKMLYIDKDGGEVALIPKEQLSIRNFNGWGNPVQSNLFGNMSKPAAAGNQNAGKNITNTIGDIIIEHTTDLNDFVNQLKTRIKSFGAIID